MDGAIISSSLAKDDGHAIEYKCCTMADRLRWSYTGAEGALVFCADKAKGGLWFRVVDLSVSCP